MSSSKCIVNAQLLKDCLYAFNQIPNTRLHNGLCIYDLAKDIGAVIAQEPIAETDISISWGILDVQHSRPDLSDEQAMEVLIFAKANHDSTVGINWDVLKTQANLLFPIDN